MKVALSTDLYAADSFRKSYIDYNNSTYSILMELFFD